MADQNIFNADAFNCRMPHHRAIGQTLIAIYQHILNEHHMVEAEQIDGSNHRCLSASEHRE
ncbi:hypothetical protein ACNKHN_08480 [Shigella flexneri]